MIRIIMEIIMKAEKKMKVIMIRITQMKVKNPNMTKKVWLLSKMLI